MDITNIDFEGLLNEEEYFEFDSEDIEYTDSSGDEPKS